MKTGLVAKGAEANLFLRDNVIVKERISKKYRIKEIDGRLRRIRTQREAKLLDNARRAGVAVPLVKGVDLDNCTILMEYIMGEAMKDYLEKAGPEEVDLIGKLVGESVSRMHNANIIHNDLTTSNMIVLEGRVYFIDFGLGGTSTRVEDKAVDLVVLKKSVRVSHDKIAARFWNKFLEGYAEAKRLSEILGRVNVIEKRVRYAPEGAIEL
jgi:Kae1-associated kinase Bud32